MCGCRYVHIPVPLPVLTRSSVQPVKHIVQHTAAGFAVNVVAVASFPEFSQITCILYDLRMHADMG